MNKIKLVNANNSELGPMTKVNLVQGLCETNMLDKTSVRVMHRKEFSMLPEKDISTMYLLIKDRYQFHVPNVEVMVPHSINPIPSTSTFVKGDLSKGKCMELNEHLLFNVLEVVPRGMGFMRIYDRRSGYWATDVRFAPVLPPMGDFINGIPPKCTQPYTINQYGSCLLHSMRVYKDNWVIQIFNDGGGLLGFNMLKLPHIAPITDMNLNPTIVFDNYSYSAPLSHIRENCTGFTVDDSTGLVYMITNGSIANTNPAIRVYALNIGDAVNRVAPSTTLIFKFNRGLDYPDNIRTGAAMSICVIDNIIRLAWTGVGDKFFTADFDKVTGEHLKYNTIINTEYDAKYESVGSAPQNSISIPSTDSRYLVSTPYGDAQYGYLVDGFVVNNKLAIQYFDISNETIVGNSTICYSYRSYPNSIGTLLCSDGSLYIMGSKTSYPEQLIIKYTYSDKPLAWTKPKPAPMFKMGEGAHQFPVIFNHNGNIYFIPYSYTLAASAMTVPINTITSNNPGNFAPLGDYMEEWYGYPEIAISRDAMYIKSNNRMFISTAVSDNMCRLLEILDPIQGTAVSCDMGTNYNSLIFMMSTPLFNENMNDSFYGCIGSGYSHVFDQDVKEIMGIYQFNEGDPIKIIGVTEKNVVISPIGFKSDGTMIYQKIKVREEKIQNYYRLDTTTILSYDFATGQSTILVENVRTPEWIDTAYGDGLAYDLFNSLAPPFGLNGDNKVKYTTPSYVCMDRYVFRSPDFFHENSDNMWSGHDCMRVLSTNSDMDYHNVQFKYTYHSMYAYDLVENVWIKLEEAFNEISSDTSICVRVSDTEFKFFFGVPDRSDSRGSQYTTKTYDISKDINIINGKSMT